MPAPAAPQGGAASRRAGPGLVGQFADVRELRVHDRNQPCLLHGNSGSVRAAHASNGSPGWHSAVPAPPVSTAWLQQLEGSPASGWGRRMLQVGQLSAHAQHAPCIPAAHAAPAALKEAHQPSGGGGGAAASSEGTVMASGVADNTGLVLMRECSGRWAGWAKGAASGSRQLSVTASARGAGS